MGEQIIDWENLKAEVTEAFSPGAPIAEKDLFAGRLDQIATLLETVQQRGRHAVVYGERGAGKTSLVNILKFLVIRPTVHVFYVRVNASPNDTFSSLWKKIFKRLSYESGGAGARRIADDYPGELTPDDVQMELETFEPHHVPIIVLDEFDRLEDQQVSRQVADTIKALSDYSVNATVVVVGVAENVEALIEGHQSISRSLVQVQMRRMSISELREIVTSRYTRCGLHIDEGALQKIAVLSRGLPNYAHLLGMHSAWQAIFRRNTRVSEEDVKAALGTAIADLDRTIKDSYYSATVSQRPSETLYEPVLLACALAACDELGRFQPAAVAEPLNRIVEGKNYTASTFAFHMNAFCTPARRNVLERVGEERNYRYRFTDPMMQPFVIMKGLSDNRIDDKLANWALQRMTRTI